ncbi:hypothetical protein HYH03_010077 [Edaphochlamys debaryana]|uniref:Uncharacterized protein n=1 Tax=Edaphochlamys debaryana TaxID=47281 RepID=A0A836BXS0_9CHLO|nr:hypothetical protein HYH03_010077 [Edaphochlamys debaryana]|eukprot:KAG2491499.1 hypothetical protein HYH03_010077 [Edaphochlamys debaryana]
MPQDPIPRDPVYMTYIFNHNQGLPPSPYHDSQPYRPATGLTHTELQLESSRGVYQHFHRPFNDHSRFLAVATPVEKAACRDTPRLAPPPWDGSTQEWDRASGRRPGSAPASGRRRTGSAGGSPAGPTGQPLELGGATLLDNMTTQTGVPCYTVPSIIEADIAAGTPILDAAVESAMREVEDWRVARVQTYQVPPSRVGYGEGGVRPFHQDYRHYKYYGFAGHGAKTSWAHNPKYARVYAEVFTSTRDSTSPASTADAPPGQPLQQMVGGPRRPLTPAERKMVPQFRWHNYPSEGVPSDPKVTDLLTDVAAGRSPSPEVLSHLKVPQAAALASVPGGAAMRSAASRAAGRTGAGTGGGGSTGRARPLSAHATASCPPGYSHTTGEFIEPFSTKVDLEVRTPLPPETPMRGAENSKVARVTTYRQLSSPYAAELNRSPNHGSQAPWHQRYGHYKYSGFAGKGASSSWARNPKYAVMYDN